MEFGANETTCPNGDVPTHTIDYPHLLRLAAKSKVPLYASSEFKRLTFTLMLLNTYAPSDDILHFAH
jgi:hypothetical protein